jgi:hypothetical protein
MKNNYKSIQFLPDHFNEYLLNEVGFREAVELGTVEGTKKGKHIKHILYIKCF